MQRFTRWCPAGLLTALALGAAAAGRPQWPAAVAEELGSYLVTCRDAGGTPDSRQAVTALDLNGDGVSDYVIDVGQISCEGAWSIFGDREKPVSVFVGSATGDAMLAFSDSAYGSRVEQNRATGKLWLTVAGGRCGLAPARDFASEGFCERALVWDGNLRRFNYADLSAARQIK